MIITRYMTEDTAARIVAHLFYPEMVAGRELGDETYGVPMIATRDHPAEMWSVPRENGERLALGTWREACHHYGFTVEVLG